VLAGVAKSVMGDEKRAFHRWIAANSPAAINQRQVLKLALWNQLCLMIFRMVNSFVGGRALPIQRYGCFI
jgi:hypothetical protein